MFDWPTKMAKRKTLPQGVREWYDSDAPGLTADILIRDLHMNPETKVPLINIVGDTALGLIPVADLPNQIPNYIAMPLPLARVLAEHLVMLLTQAQVLAPAVAVPPVPPVPIITPPPLQNQPPQPPPPAPPPQPPQMPAPAPQPAAPPPQTTWQHVQENRAPDVHQVPPAPTAIPPQPTLPPQTPTQQTPPAVPQYQKPLTSVPQYRNADLYQKPENTAPPSNLTA